MLPNSVTNRERDEPARRQGAEEMARERPSILQQAAAAQPMNAAFNRLHIEGVDTVVHRLPTGRSSQCSRQVGRTWIGDCPLAEGRARSPASLGGSRERRDDPADGNWKSDPVVCGLRADEGVAEAVQEAVFEYWRSPLRGYLPARLGHPEPEAGPAARRSA